MGETSFAELPTALYGAVLLLAGIAYYILSSSLVAHHGQDSVLATGVNKDIKGKISVVLYLLAIPLAFVSPWIQRLEHGTPRNCAPAHRSLPGPEGAGIELS
jgi:uncharacterized membrane protein